MPNETTCVIRHLLRWGEKMATFTKITPKQPRFILSLREGRLFYTCRGCKHQCHHAEFIVKHLQVCNAF
jgi:hypothetical protein